MPLDLRFADQDRGRDEEKPSGRRAVEDEAAADEEEAHREISRKKTLTGKKKNSLRTLPSFRCICVCVCVMKF